MDTTVTSVYQAHLVAISFVLAFIGSFIALMVTRRIRRKDGSINWVAALIAGVALGGIGVWSMHFMGMVALDLNVASSYGILETVVSLVAAIACTSVSLIIVSTRPEDILRILGAGLLLGAGVVAMHYLGMFGMKIGGYIIWDMKTVAISAVIAVVAATVALWLAFNTQQLSARLGAALLMACAVCAMHYTCMSAAEFVCTTPNRLAAVQGEWLVSSIGLSSMVAVSAFAMATLISLDLAMQWMQRSVLAKASQVGTRAI